MFLQPLLFPVTRFIHFITDVSAYMLWKKQYSKSPTLGITAIRIQITCINQIGAFKFKQRMSEHLLVFSIEPSGLRRHFVYDTYKRHEIIIQQILHKITSYETASCFGDKMFFVLFVLSLPLYYHTKWTMLYLPPKIMTLGFLSEPDVAIIICHLKLAGYFVVGLVNLD